MMNSILTKVLLFPVLLLNLASASRVIGQDTFPISINQQMFNISTADVEFVAPFDELWIGEKWYQFSSPIAQISLDEGSRYAVKTYNVKSKCYCYENADC